VFTSDGRGSDIMVSMAGGMVIAMLTVFVVPVLYCWVEMSVMEKGRKIFDKSNCH
jgi:Cu(I)/Ag(I) efflux system membrane protein CusA/SilA